jgi:hypothetical protein
LIRELVFNAYAAVIPGAVLGITLTGFLSYYWFRILRESQNQPVILADSTVIRKRFNLLVAQEYMQSQGCREMSKSTIS